MAKLVKDTVDSRGAVVAAVEVSKFVWPPKKPKVNYHAICIPGCRVNSEGHMDVQVVDSAYGKGALTIEGLYRELNGHDLVPFAVVKAA